MYECNAVVIIMEDIAHNEMMKRNSGIPFSFFGTTAAPKSNHLLASRQPGERDKYLPFLFHSLQGILDVVLSRSYS